MKSKSAAVKISSKARLNMKTRFLVLLLLNLVLVLSANGQFSANFQTNTISAVTSNWVGNGTYVVGSNTFRDALIIQNSGVLSNGFGYIGYESSASNNIAIVRDSVSAWSNQLDLIVGFQGAGNQLVISNAGSVYSANGTVGVVPSASNNAVIVAGSNSVWTIANELIISSNGPNNTLIITNGGRVFDAGALIGTDVGASRSAFVLVTGTNSFWNNSTNALVSTDYGFGITIANGGRFAAGGTVQIGRSAGASGNIVLVTDPGSTWSNGTILQVSGFSGFNQFIVSNGATAYSGSGTIGPNLDTLSNSVVVTGPGSVWTVGGSISISDSGGLDNSLVVTNGSLVSAQDEFLTRFGGRGALVIAGGTNIVSDQIQIGALGGTGTVSVLGGALFVTNALATATVTVNTNSTLLLGAGTFKADNLIVTNGGAVQYLQALQVDNASVSVAAGGSLVATNAPTTIGSVSNSTATVIVASNATVSTALTTLASGTNSTASLTVQDVATVNVLSNLIVAPAPGANAIVTMTGGTLVVTNGTIGVGNNGSLTGGSGTALFSLQNAVVYAQDIKLGSSAGGSGQMIMKAGSVVHLNSKSCPTCGLTYNDGVLDGGTIDGSNATMWAGWTHPGTFIGSNGVATIGTAYFGFNDVGTFTQVGATFNVLTNLIVGTAPGATGIVTMTGGSIYATNGTFAIGNGGSLYSTGGVGHASISAGTVDAASILVGDNFGSDANLTVSGTAVVRAHGGFRSNGIRTTVVNGGALQVVDGPVPPFEDPILFDRIVVSYLADGKMIVSNGAVSTPGMIVAASAGNTGTLNIVGGTTSVYSNMTVGLVACSATGIVNVSGGSLFVTNGGTAVLEVRSGTFTQSGGFVSVDKLVVTNACAQLVRSGGTLLYNQLVLSPNLSAAGDGIPNGWKQQYGLDPFYATLAGQDLDGTGFTVQQDYQAGFNPTNPAAYPHVISVAKVGNDIQVTYLGANGDSTWAPGIASRTNVLEFTTGMANGAYSNNFVGIRTNVLSGGTGLGIVTNMVDSGGTTNMPARYYRIRVLP